MLRRSLLIIGLLAATISVYGKPLVERRTTPRNQSPQSTIVNDDEEACGDVAEADHIIISKESLTLKLYDKSNRLICRFPISLGRHYGDKQALGDLKTPEGEYSIVQIQRASHWMYNDGKANIKGYYGNWFIRLNTPYSGIGIHGTHEPEHIGERTTEGSIRLNNYHLDSLRTMIDVGMVVRIESSPLDMKADGREPEQRVEPTIVAENAHPIIDKSATPVIEEHQEVAKPTEIATTEVVERVAEEPKPQKQVESSTPSSDEWYTIKEGDIVGRIASNYGISVAEIKRLNPELNVDRISIGQRIRVRALAAKAESIEEPTEVVSEIWHTVVEGDLVGRIAAQYGTTTRSIKELNPELDPDRISIGQRIRVK